MLRLDGRGAVSVQLMGRNEIPEDEYLRVLASVAPVQPEAAAPVEDDPDGDGTNR